MKFFLDEGAPVKIGEILTGHGFDVIHFQQAALPGSPDNVVADIALANNAVLVAVDRDMKQIAKALGVSNSRYKKLSLLAFRCREPDAAQRLLVAMPYIQLQSKLNEGSQVRRLFIEIFPNSVKVYDF